MLDLSNWTKTCPDMRVIVRRELPHPGATLDAFEIRDGYRYQAFTTNTPRGQLAFLEARHRAHARVEDRIRTGKDTGLGHLPSRHQNINEVWVELTLIAADLLALSQSMLLTDQPELHRAEPKTLRYRLLHTAALKLTTRCGTAAVEGCNEALLAKAADAKLLRTNRLRADTTVVPADVAYPTDSGLLPRRSGGSRSPAGGSRPRVARPAPGCGTAAGRRASGPTASPRSFGCAQLRAATRRRPPCSGSPVSSPSWPNAQPATLRSSWRTPGGPCAALRPRPRHWLQQEPRTQPRVGGAAGCAGR